MKKFYGLLAAIILFEVFNFLLTRFALRDILGALSIAGFLWSNLLAIAFAGIDMAFIGRIFKSDSGQDNPEGLWYLFGAWFLAAAFNASLSWWGIGVFFNTSVRIIPVLVAAIILALRVCLIGLCNQAAEWLPNRTKYLYKGQNPQTEYFSIYVPELRDGPRKNCPWCDSEIKDPEDQMIRCPYCNGSLRLEDS